MTRHCRDQAQIAVTMTSNTAALLERVAPELDVSRVVHRLRVQVLARFDQRSSGLEGRARRRAEHAHPLVISTLRQRCEGLRFREARRQLADQTHETLGFVALFDHEVELRVNQAAGE